MTSLAHFENVAASIELPGEAVIDGASRPSLTGRSFDNVTPRNGTVINRVAECGAADVDAAVAAARRAFEDGRWRKLHYRDKKRILYALADLIERDAEMLAVLESLDVGKPIKDALNIDVRRRCAPCATMPRHSIRFMARWAPRRRTVFPSQCMSRLA